MDEIEDCNWTAEKLIDFENEIASAFNEGLIRAPIHLSYDTESSLIELFTEVRDQDWVFCSWRSHYQSLLKGVPEEVLRKSIFEGRSIALCFPERRVFSSAIVGGILPIALGTALSISRRGLDEYVWCFMGDMTSETGLAYSCIKYAQNYKLPITFVIEDNDLSVCTPTREVWKLDELSVIEGKFENIIRYKYKNKYPHAGAGKRVQF
jgi:pyruvate dehydrogenase E1 component alpha subunit